ncbi:hypothetical protein PC129_g19793 [Phytophthora cactorum]|uniref:Uncharacterized protein n=1 Tax=Phytophthora cactorum TaxID=29920 RepID=A0A8T1B0S3_9STRA|nr:hypothetical protein Pcac1_g19549 [Phytophthora cactorum]KAG2799951.1 hypothetical protein PC111_g20180 [Phytophthora cactorum]KAG2802001.1 hypothetical protein PC112_g19806 [Phytophthora cactorum]KAG2838659.1 hypothetical protein PC113_g19623 [Phytophthora cactorum]KAG2881498.1 hypothetical protein PC114_g21521 [Phytophthora cactorum]
MQTLRTDGAQSIAQKSSAAREIALLKEEQINCIKQLKVRDVVAKQLYFGIAGAEVDGDDAQSVAGYCSEVFVGLFGERCAAQQGET